MEKPKKRNEYMRLLADFSTIGITLAACVFIGFGFGYYLDTKVFAGKTKPWLMLIFLLLGVAAGFKNLYQLSRRKDL
nr:AtpZ/AtpI family protein [Desulfobulbaceae bacterium]